MQIDVRKIGCTQFEYIEMDLQPQPACYLLHRFPAAVTGARLLHAPPACTPACTRACMCAPPGPASCGCPTHPAHQHPELWPEAARLPPRAAIARTRRRHAAGARRAWPRSRQNALCGAGWGGGQLAGAAACGVQRGSRTCDSRVGHRLQAACRLSRAQAVPAAAASRSWALRRSRASAARPPGAQTPT